MNGRIPERDALPEPDAKREPEANQPDPNPPDAWGDARPALTPSQLAFLALIAALILTALRHLRRRGRAPERTGRASREG